MDHLTVYNYKDYRSFLKEALKAKRGAQSELARALRTSSVFVSQVLSGKREFSVEQAWAATEHFQMPHRAASYFLLLVQSARAGTKALRKEFDRQLEELRTEALQVIHQVRTDRKLGEAEKAEFYSDWKYSAIRIATSVEGLETAEALARRFDLSPDKVSSILDFLVRTGLCEYRHGKYSMGATITHLEKDSPWTRFRHSQWRHKAVEAMSDANTLSFTAPLSISKEDAQQLRTEWLAKIAELSRRVEKSKAQELWCFNLDWFPF